MRPLLLITTLLGAAFMTMACGRPDAPPAAVRDLGDSAQPADRPDSTTVAPRPDTAPPPPTATADATAPLEGPRAEAGTVGTVDVATTEPAVVVTADPTSAPTIARPAPAEPDGFDLRGVHTGLGDAPEDPEGEPDEPAADPDSNVDRTWSERDDDVPTFPDDDPLLASGIPLCRALVEGVRACRPKLDADLRNAIDPLIAAILNGARSLRRSVARTRACEMGWASLPEMLEKYCPGAFDPSFPRSLPTE
jgi:hypothetical protein